MRETYPFHAAVQTRWSDNDMFGHVNNVEFYRFFEVAVAEFLRGPCRLDMMASPSIPFAAESLCRFLRPLSWPQPVIAALGIEHVGTSSVRYAIALFAGDEAEPAAEGHWVHVFVDRATGRPVPIPGEIRKVFEAHRRGGE